MTNINYNKAIVKIANFSTSWNKRYLTPLGKITVIKTFLLSQLNHLFTSLPNPSNETVTEISRMLFNFLWDGKTDKVARDVTILNYNQGGLKMLDIATIIKSLKITWIRRLHLATNQPFAEFFNENIYNISDLFSLGQGSLNEIILNTKNKFWSDTLSAWKEMCNKTKISNINEAYSVPLWSNPIFSPEYLLDYSTWYNQGINLIGDLINDDGSIMSLNEVQRTYKIPHFNFLNYLSVKTLIRRLFKEHNLPLHPREKPLRPLIPLYLQTIIKNHKGSRHIYNIFVSNNDVQCVEKWNERLSTQILEKQWKINYKLCFNTVKDNYLIWFQYKILRGILGVKYYLKKINITDNPMCSLCNRNEETLPHLFFGCIHTRIFWYTIFSWIFRKTSIQIDLTEQEILLGYSSGNNNQVPLNTILMCTKAYIFYCSRLNKQLNFTHLLNRLRQTYQEQEYIAKRNEKELQFRATWNRWKILFETI